MSWDPAWDAIFADREWRKYPSEDLIRFIARYYYRVADRSAVRILEVGCGSGGNTWFLAREGFSAHGMDGSFEGIRRAKDRLESEGLNADLRVGDMLALTDMYALRSFDAVVDVGGIQCNRRAEIVDIVHQIASLLKPGGRFFLHAIARGTSFEGQGKMLEPHTYTEVEGPLAGTGVVHFFDDEEIRQVLDAFREVETYKYSRTFAGSDDIVSHWIATAVLPA